MKFLRFFWCWAIFAASLVPMKAHAQFFRVEDLPRNDISLSYGVGSSPVVHQESCSSLRNFGSARDAIYDCSDEKFCFSMNCVYVRNILNRFGVGIQVNYFSDDELYTYLSSNHYYGQLASITEEGCTIMPTVRCYWWNHHHIGLYTRFAAGIGFHIIKEEDLNLHDDLDFNCGTLTDSKFAYQLSLIGIEAGGRRIRGFAEGGLGSQCNLNFGMRIKFGYK